MPRAKLPYPADLIATIRTLPWFNDGLVLHGAQAEHRMYDRTSGNFKASGWLVTVTVANSLDIETANRYEVRIFIADSDMVQSRQTQFRV